MAKKAASIGAEKKGTWPTYRPDIKVLDCTIRDGGLVNNSQFTDEFVRAVY
jgi:4-hydroxy 2-oxovalerate aldolase